jgi:hypothetical protein
MDIGRFQQTINIKLKIELRHWILTDLKYYKANLKIHISNINEPFFLKGIT